MYFHENNLQAWIGIVLYGCEGECTNTRRGIASRVVQEQYSEDKGERYDSIRKLLGPCC
jgi:hypothetical protein